MGADESALELVQEKRKGFRTNLFYSIPKTNFSSRKENISFLSYIPRALNTVDT